MAGKTRVLRFTADNTTAGAFSFTIPGGCTRFRARLVGGGGGGGGGGRGNTQGGEGGGGGGGAKMVDLLIDCLPGETWTGQLGAGGAGGLGYDVPTSTLGSSGDPGGDTTLTNGIFTYYGYGADGGGVGSNGGENKAGMGGSPVKTGSVLSSTSAPLGDIAAGYLAAPPGSGGTHITLSNQTIWASFMHGRGTPQSKPGDGGSGNDFNTSTGKGGGGGGASEWPYNSISGLPQQATGGSGGGYQTSSGAAGNNGADGQYGGGGGGGGGGHGTNSGFNSGGNGGNGGMGCVEIILEL